MVRKLALFAVLVALCSPALARGRRYSNYTYTYTQTTTNVATGETSTAQGIANIMARCGRVGHWGGNPGYEGCGCGASPAAAYAICCYGNSGMKTVDVGYAQGSNGIWYCCRRYGR